MFKSRLVIIAYVNSIFKKLHLTHRLCYTQLFSSLAELPNEFNTPPFIIVGSKLLKKILDTKEVVVVFPCEPSQRHFS